MRLPNNIIFVILIILGLAASTHLRKQENSQETIQAGLISLTSEKQKEELSEPSEDLEHRGEQMQAKEAEEVARQAEEEAAARVAEEAA